MLPKPTINSTMCKNSHPKHERRKKSDQPSRVIHPIPCHPFSPETVVQNEQAARKEEHGTSQADRKTNADRTTATEHEHDTNDMSPTPLHSTTNHPRLGEIPRWYGIREVAVLVSLVSGTILLGLKGWSVRELEGRYLYKRSLNGLTRCHHKREQVG